MITWIRFFYNDIHDALMIINRHTHITLAMIIDNKIYGFMYISYINQKL